MDQKDIELLESIISAPLSVDKKWQKFLNEQKKKLSALYENNVWKTLLKIECILESTGIIANDSITYNPIMPKRECHSNVDSFVAKSQGKWKKLRGWAVCKNDDYITAVFHSLVIHAADMKIYDITDSGVPPPFIFYVYNKTDIQPNYIFNLKGRIIRKFHANELSPDEKESLYARYKLF